MRPPRSEAASEVPDPVGRSGASAPLRLCLAGASTDTGNEGVSALCLSVLFGIAQRAPDADVTVFDQRRGSGEEEVRSDAVRFRFRRCGLHASRRFYRRESLLNARLSAALGGLGSPIVSRMRASDAVLDITGGDSFTDLYGRRRFDAGAAQKRLSARLSGGLLLLPQTYGPFGSARSRRIAADLVARARGAWARDEESFAVLRDLLGEGFDPADHRRGVDVAFRLPVRRPAELPSRLEAWLAPGRDVPVVGINVSGLIHNRPDAARAAYGLSADYRAAVRELVDRFLARTTARVLLVPHVATETGHFESDPDACEAVLAAVSSGHRDRVAVAPDPHAMEAKWVISRLDWFCGTRMHSTIAALSTGVPSAALAYSKKTRGVFATCGQEEHVADLRTAGAGECADVAWRSFEGRDAARGDLARKLPEVLRTADSQMDDVVAACRRLAAVRRGRA